MRGLWCGSFMNNGLPDNFVSLYLLVIHLDQSVINIFLLTLLYTYDLIAPIPWVGARMTPHLLGLPHTARVVLLLKKVIDVS